VVREPSARRCVPPDSERPCECEDGTGVERCEAGTAWAACDRTPLGSGGGEEDATSGASDTTSVDVGASDLDTVDPALDGTWSWTDGASTVYTHCSALVPNDAEGGEDYAEVGFTDALSDDRSCGGDPGWGCRLRASTC
jgi:hypothetical protein